MLKTLHKLFASKSEPVPIVHVKERALPSPETPWEDSDSLELSKFLRSATGVRLMQRARTVEYHNSINANKDPFHSAHSGGRAMGFSECLTWFESMRFSQPAATQQEQSDDSDQNQAESSAIRRF